MQQMQQNRFAFLDGIRGLGAIFVVTRHTEDFWNFTLFRNYIAVDLFFILSGFVIAFAYDKKLSTGSMSFSKFLKIRLIRFYPVFLLSLAIISAKFITHAYLKHEFQIDKVTEFAYLVGMSAFFLPSHIAQNESFFPINGPYWSLFFELISNIIYGAIQPFLNNIVLITTVVLSGISMAVFSYYNGTLNGGSSWGVFQFFTGFSRSVFGIFFGLLLYRNYDFFSRYLGKLMSPWLTYVIISIILVSPSFGHYDWFIDMVLVFFVLPILVICAAQGASQRTEKVLLLLGAASYPMYVLHIPLGEVVSMSYSYFLNGRVENHAPFSGIILVVILIIVSVLVDKHFDSPVRRWLSGKLIKREPLKQSA
ncbi:MAG: acyltransferase [Chlorobiales bacterium]|nr:acyltransferase [Chlorobiales bacterium]